MRGQRRLDFFEMPTTVTDAVQAAVDGPVVRYWPAQIGFSSGPAGRCLLEDGRSVFLKACSDELNAVSTRMHRREADMLLALPANHPSPALLETVDLDGWFVLVVEYVAGRTPVAPIGQSETVAVLDLVTALAEHGTQCSADRFTALGTGDHVLEKAWTKMLHDGIPEGIDPWSRRHVSELATLETDWIEAVSGDSLLHGDLRPDNMVLTGRGGDIAVDWPAACRGASWVDLVGLLPALEMLDGPKPHDVFSSHPVGAAADAAAVDSFLALLTGYFTSQSLLPPIKNVPGIREFQAAQGAVCRTWLSDRFGWDPPEV